MQVKSMEGKWEHANLLPCICNYYMSASSDKIKHSGYGESGGQRKCRCGQSQDQSISDGVNWNSADKQLPLQAFKIPLK